MLRVLTESGIALDIFRITQIHQKRKISCISNIFLTHLTIVKCTIISCFACREPHFTHDTPTLFARNFTLSLVFDKKNLA